ncbi:MAG: hypothetical protein EU535_03190 [Promethearchaeota archaeon]|nr:MAG: hypothetical protein EU535_03190 [Candidatus Lokiarchaeota archaeon]
MPILLTLIDISFITFTFLISIYFDLKFRKIPNNFLKISFLIGLILNICDFFFDNNFFLNLILRILFLLLIFLISLILFLLKIIGGGDGKVILLIFLVHPILYLNCYIISLFFLLFSLLFLTFFFFNMIINSTTKINNSFQIYFKFCSNILFTRFFIKMFYKFFDLSNLKNYNGDKFFIKTIFIIYNHQKREFQILAQYRPPLIILCLLSYFLLFLLIIVI